MAHPRDIQEYAPFVEGVDLLSSEPDAVLLEYFQGDNAVIASMALSALARRADGDTQAVRREVLAGAGKVVPWTRYFALECLQQLCGVDDALLGSVLGVLQDSDYDDVTTAQMLRSFIQRRLAGGDPIALEAAAPALTIDGARRYETMIGIMDADAVGPLRDALRAWQSSTIDTRLLGSVGRLWGRSEAQEAARDVIAHPDLAELVDRVEAIVLRESRRSLVLVGESGTGKTAAVRALGLRLAQQGWTLFEAGAAQVLAGQKYIGELEQRLTDLASALDPRRKILWYIPDFHALRYAGKHRFSPVGMLDNLLPHIEEGRILVLGETRARPFEQLVKAMPGCLLAMEAVRVHPLSDAATVSLARAWSEHHRDGAHRLCDDSVLSEAWSLAKQHLGHEAAPGNLLALLNQTRQRRVEGRLASPGAADSRSRLADAEEGGQAAGSRLSVDDFVETVSQLTGLPSSVLDDRQGLPVDTVREFFSTRVLGQPEAVECLVERVALVKAGLTDPSRPLGVFLFAGPTGTGKTEIAKTTAAFLFGSADRMIRVDMSELQTPESMSRLVGGGDNPESVALVDGIREHPFSVVLLDELEKAHPNVWDLFLQVFDDGRLTDRQGNTADFRHAIIIATANVGAAEATTVSVGFNAASRGFAPSDIERGLNRVFRKEFLNRLDRIVVFRPFGREVMRKLLLKELEGVFQRRGLRKRRWAVEWDNGAIDFLLRKGFTADLGARPLKRAVERHLLAPLAVTIVNHQFPEGDQFLFVGVDNDRLTVEFVDPDAQEPEPGSQSPVATESLKLTAVALDPMGTSEEMELLRDAHGRIQHVVRSDAWSTRKQDALAAMSVPAFWAEEGRFATLGVVETLDRIESGLSSASSMVERLQRSRSESKPRDLVRRLAERLYLLESACAAVQHDAPQDAFLLVETGPGQGGDHRVVSTFAARLSRMYKNWARLRRMRLDVLHETNGSSHDSAFRCVLAVSGFAAHGILAPETGLHIHELPASRENRDFNRRAVRVRVTPQPACPPDAAGSTLLDQAESSFAAESSETHPPIVRRYREAPSPLVRDTVRNWRTGRLDIVLDGNFDLL